jgi:hypothetical protein
MNTLKKNYNCTFPKIFHWSCAEKLHYDKSLNIYSNNDNLNFLDLLKIFKSEPIILENCYSFSLKHVSKTMYNYKMIDTIWEHNAIDGKEAMIHAWISNKICKKHNNSIKETGLLEEIEKYNYVDCKVLHEIVQYFRKNMINNK